MNVKHASPRSAFLQQFEPEFIPYFLQFCEGVSNLQTDVVMYTARKAVCLFESAKRLGLLNTRGIATSDRVLDMDTQWLRGRSVTIVDDVLITGSSLFRAQEVLRAAGCSNVEVRALAVNTEHWVPELADPVSPYLQLDNRHALGLCTQIVEAISVVPHPYNVDWPQLDGVTSPADKRLGLVLGVNDWDAREVTSTLQERYGIRNVTYSPSARVMRSVELALGVPRELMPLSKVRVYYSPRRDRDGWDISATPVIHFDALTNGTIDRLFETHCGFANINSSQFTTQASRLRALQFRASVLLADAWCEDARGTTLATPPRLSRATAEFLVPPQSVACLLRDWKDSPRQITPVLIKTSTLQEPSLPVPDDLAHTLSASQNQLQAALTDPFMDLYMTKELQARAILRTEHTAAFANHEYQEIINRLAEGFTAKQLETLVSAVSDGAWGRHALSTYLDIAIDHGMAVPITQHRNGSVRRAFRHGEDIVFGLNEMRLFSIALDAAASATPTRSIGRREVEKICVLVLKIGVKRRILNQWFGRLGHANTVGVRWHLKGALVQSGAEALFGANLDKGLTDLLVREGVLHRLAAGKYKVSTFDDRAPTSTLAEGTALIVGHILGQLLSPAAQNRLSADDITLLASCDSLLSLVGAMAAEVSLVHASWQTHRFRIESRAPTTAKSVQEMLRTSDLFEAANSGAWKYRSYRSGRPGQIVDRVAQSIHDPLMRAEWRMFWDDTIDPKDTGAPQLESLATETGRWLYAASANLHLIRACLAHESGSSAKRVLGYLTSAEKWARDHAAEKGVASTDIGRLVDRTEKLIRNGGTDQVAAVLGEALANMDLLNKWAPRLLDQARIVTRPLREAPTIINYTSALAIRFSGDMDEGDAFAASVSELFGRAKRASNGRPYRIERANELAGCTADHILVARGANGPSILRQLANSILSAAPHHSQVSIFLYPQLSPIQAVFSTAEAVSFHGDGFVDLVEQLLAIHAADRRSCLRIVTNGVLSQQQRNALDLNDLSQEVLAEVGHPIVEEVDLATLETIDAVQADVGIVTIISEEARAVKEWLSSCDQYHRRVRGDGTVFHTAKTMANGRVIEVAHTQAVDQGQTSALVAHQELAREYRVAFNVLLGISGSIHKDVGLGDVVLGDQVIDYGPQALTEQGPRHRGGTLRPPAVVARGLNDFFSSGDDPRRIEASPEAAGMGRPEFALIRGPIGTGYAVVKFRESEVREWLESFNEKTLVLETEAEGAARHFYESGETNRSVGYIVLRGVSDHADEKKDDKWKLAASRNAVRALQLLLPTIREALDLKTRELGA